MKATDIEFALLCMVYEGPTTTQHSSSSSGPHCILYSHPTELLPSYLTASNHCPQPQNVLPTDSLTSIPSSPCLLCLPPRAPCLTPGLLHSVRPGLALLTSCGTSNEPSEVQTGSHLPSYFQHLAQHLAFKSY